MAKRRVLILGAGLAGLSAAWHLQKKDIDCQIFEEESEVGGLCRSKNINGFIFDYDGHLLHFRHRYAFNLIKDLLGDNLLKHRRSAWVYSYGRYTPYPFQVNLHGLPKRVIKECLLEFIQTANDGQYEKKRNLNFLDWINNNLGKGIARNFMIPYNTKFWTLSPKKLTCEWLDGFIPVPSLSQIIEGTMGESKRQYGYNAHFWYPKRGGIACLPLALADRIKNIHINSRTIEINLDKKEIKIASGSKVKFDYLISTIPLPEMAYIIKGIPKEIFLLFKKLKWNSIFNLNLGIERKNYSGKHWIYFPQRKICFFRVGFFHNFSPNLISLDKSSLYVEVSYSKNKLLDKSDIVRRIKRDLEKVGILTRDDRVCAEDINDIKYGYPIYDRNYGLARKEILKFLLKNNIFLCGRYGSWRYMSMEDVILDGKIVADKLLREYELSR